MQEETLNAAKNNGKLITGPIANVPLSQQLFPMNSHQYLLPEAPMFLAVPKYASIRPCLHVSRSCRVDMQALPHTLSAEQQLPPAGVVSPAAGCNLQRCACCEGEVARRKNSKQHGRAHFLLQCSPTVYISYSKQTLKQLMQSPKQSSWIQMQTLQSSSSTSWMPAIPCNWTRYNNAKAITIGHACSVIALQMPHLWLTCLLWIDCLWLSLSLQEIRKMTHADVKRRGNSMTHMKHSNQNLNRLRAGFASTSTASGESWMGSASGYHTLWYECCLVCCVLHGNILVSLNLHMLSGFQSTHLLRLIDHMSSYLFKQRWLLRRPWTLAMTHLHFTPKRERRIHKGMKGLWMTSHMKLTKDLMAVETSHKDQRAAEAIRETSWNVKNWRQLVSYTSRFEKQTL